MTKPDRFTGQRIEALRQAAGWRFFDVVQGFSNDLLYVDGKTTGVIEAKKEGLTLSGVERQAEKYTEGRRVERPSEGRRINQAQSVGIQEIMSILYNQ